MAAPLRAGRASGGAHAHSHSPRSQSRCSSPQEYAALSITLEAPVANRGLTFPVPLKATLPTLELFCEFSLGHLAMSFPNPSAVLRIG